MPSSWRGTQGRHGHLNPKARQPRRVRGFLRGHLDFQTLGRQRSGLQILRGVEPRAGPQRDQQILRRRHAAVRSAVIGRLVAHHAMTPRAGFEPDVTEMLNADFHDGFHTIRDANSR